MKIGLNRAMKLLTAFVITELCWVGMWLLLIELASNNSYALDENTAWILNVSISGACAALMISTIAVYASFIAFKILKD